MNDNASAVPQAVECEKLHVRIPERKNPDQREDVATQAPSCAPLPMAIDPDFRIAALNRQIAVLIEANAAANKKIAFLELATPPSQPVHTAVTEARVSEVGKKLAHEFGNCPDDIPYWTHIARAALALPLPPEEAK